MARNDGDDNNVVTEGGDGSAKNAGGGSSKNTGGTKNVEEVQPHPVKEQLPGVQYCINSPPPWRSYNVLYL